MPRSTKQNYSHEVPQKTWLPTVSHPRPRANGVGKCILSAYKGWKELTMLVQNLQRSTGSCNSTYSAATYWTSTTDNGLPCAANGFDLPALQCSCRTGSAKVGPYKDPSLGLELKVQWCVGSLSHCCTCGLVAHPQVAYVLKSSREVLRTAL